MTEGQILSTEANNKPTKHLYHNQELNSAVYGSEWIDSRIVRPNGNGVFFVRDAIGDYDSRKYRIVVVYDDGWRTDYISVFEDSSWSSDVSHSQTTSKAIQRLVNIYWKELGVLEAYANQ